MSVTDRLYFFVIPVSYGFEVYDIDGWSTDGGDRLKSEQRGCGALTDWSWFDSTSTSDASAFFQLPIFLKDGCVERAIVSSGGPKISCVYTGERSLLRKRALEIDPPPAVKRQMSSVTASPSSQASIQSTTESVSWPTYIPQSWGPGNTVVLTTTLEVLSRSTYTTAIVLASMGASPSSSPTLSSSAPAPSGSSNPSTDGRCGADFGGTTCTGTSYGDCCSTWGWCGSGPENCGHLACDAEHGTCDPVPDESPVSEDGICGFKASSAQRVPVQRMVNAATGRENAAPAPRTVPPRTAIRSTGTAAAAVAAATRTARKSLRLVARQSPRTVRAARTAIPRVRLAPDQRLAIAALSGVSAEAQMPFAGRDASRRLALVQRRRHRGRGHDDDTRYTTGV